MPAKRTVIRSTPTDALLPSAGEALNSLLHSTNCPPLAPDTHETLRRKPRQTRGHRRVDLLLDAAASVIVQHGIQAATAEAIALEAKTAKGSLYQFFPNRDAVLSALALRYAEELRAIHEEAFPADANALTLPKLIDHIVKPLAEFHDNNPAFGRVFAISDASDGGRGAPRRIRSQLFSSVVERLDLLFAARNPHLPARDRRRISLVAAAIGQAILARRDHAALSEKKPLLDDLRRILHAYLSPVLEQDHPARAVKTVRKPVTRRARA